MHFQFYFWGTLTTTKEVHVYMYVQSTAPLCIAQ